MDDKFIIHYIGLIRDHVNRFLIQELKKHDLKGISQSHGVILGALCLKDRMQIKELAAFVNRDKSTITAIINKLINLGYVEKETDSKDNRINLIRLTEQGRKIKSNIKSISEDLRLTAYKGLSNEEKTILSMLISKISKNFTS